MQVVITPENIRRAAIINIALNEHRDVMTDHVVFPEELSSAVTPLDRRMRAIYLSAVLRLEAVISEPGSLNNYRRDYARSSGMCVCVWCGMTYSQHPPDVADVLDMVPSDCLTILCNRTRVKL